MHCENMGKIRRKKLVGINIRECHFMQCSLTSQDTTARKIFVRGFVFLHP